MKRLLRGALIISIVSMMTATYSMVTSIRPGTPSPDEERALEVTFDFHPDSTLVDTTQLLFKGNTQMLAPVFTKMQLLRMGYNTRLTVLHIGDSHIQAGFLTEAMRTNFQSDFGNAGRGLIVPLKLMGTNEPRDYAVTSDNRWMSAKMADWTPSMEVGLGGAVIACGEKEVDFTISAREPFNQITVFHHKESPLVSPAPELSTDMNCVMDNTETLTTVILNQPTTSASFTADVVDPNYTKPIFYGFSLENGGSGVMYHSMGINGVSFTNFNRNPQIIEQLAVLEPDLVIISLGTNDAYGRSYKSDLGYTQMITMIRSVMENNPTAAVMLVTPMEFYTSARRNQLNKNITDVRENLLRAADELSLPYWDMYSATGGQGAMNRWAKKNLAQRDKLHLAPDGYMLQGNMLYSTFINSYNAN